MAQKSRRRIEQKGQRDLEYIRDFDRVGRQCERRLHPADNGRHAIAGHRFIRRELAKHRDAVRGEAYFLHRFAQRRLRKRRVVGLDAAAGKADLTGVIGQVRAALREEQREAVGTVDQRDQHRCQRRSALAARQPESVAHAECVRGRGTREPLRDPALLVDR